MRILVVDNYDSFVFNLVQYLGQLGVEAEVWRNDDARLSDEGRHRRANSTVSCSARARAPRNARARRSAWSARAPRRTPRCSGSAWDTRPSVSHSAPPLTVPLSCCTVRPAAYSTRMLVCLQGLPDPFTATRYHSLTILPESLPAVLEVTARTRSGVIMAVRHTEPADPRCPVPPGVDPDRGRASDAGQLARLLRVGTRRHAGPPAGERGPRRGPAALPGFGSQLSCGY